MDKTENTLLPCPNPWCEGVARGPNYPPALRLHHFGTYRVVCTSCILEGPLRATEDEAIAAWNTRAALASHPPSDSWQPIETAPQEDGREILGYQATAGDYEGRQAVCYCLRGMYFASNGLAPTHWLPLPVPPKDHSHGG